MAKLCFQTWQNYELSHKKNRSEGATDNHKRNRKIVTPLKDSEGAILFLHLYGLITMFRELGS